MFHKILHKTKSIKPWHLFWFSILLSELLTGIIIGPMNILFRGRITYDYLITGGVCAFFVSLIIVIILILSISELQKSEKALNEQNKRLLDLSVKDYLTGVYNCRYFHERLEEEIKKIDRNRSPLSLIMLDIDYFKLYNDNHGHQMGDRVLKEVAMFLRNSIRDHDFVARYGGEEFSIILPGTGKQNARDFAERIRISLASARSFPFHHTQSHGSLTISLGIATFPDDAKSLKDLIEAADIALYKAKRNGRNRVEGL